MEEKNKEEKKELVMDVVLNGKNINISKCVPLKLRDWKLLEKDGITPKALQEAKLSDMSKVVYYILHKADSSVTVDEVDDLDLGHPTLRAVLGSLGGGEVVDRPI